jgi:hypothetical protein
MCLSNSTCATTPRGEAGTGAADVRERRYVRGAMEGGEAARTRTVQVGSGGGRGGGCGCGGGGGGGCGNGASSSGGIFFVTRRKRSRPWMPRRRVQRRVERRRHVRLGHPRVRGEWGPLRRRVGGWARARQRRVHLGGGCTWGCTS